MVRLFCVLFVLGVTGLAMGCGSEPETDRKTTTSPPPVQAGYCPQVESNAFCKDIDAIETAEEAVYYHHTNLLNSEWRAAERMCW